MYPSADPSYQGGRWGRMDGWQVYVGKSFTLLQIPMSQQVMQVTQECREVEMGKLQVERQESLEGDCSKHSNPIPIPNLWNLNPQGF